jgi:hypothetical protein
MKRKGQIQMQEMIFFIVGIVLLFSIILLFFSVFQSAKIKKLATEIRREKTIAMLESIVSMPEFSCREGFCIDEQKLVAFLDKKDEYKDLWNKSKIALIKVKRAYPNTNNIECNSENFPNCNTYIIYNSGKNYEAYATYTPLCYVYNEGGFVMERCDIAEIIVGFEVPEK